MSKIDGHLVPGDYYYYYYAALVLVKAAAEGHLFLCDVFFISPNVKLPVHLPRRRLISQRSSLETLEDIEENAPLRR